jgi:hypothetical protein
MVSTSSDANWSRASLRVFSVQMTAEEIATTLGIEADRSHHLNDPVSPRGLPYGGRKHHAFLLDSSLPKDRPLEEHLECLLDRIEPAIDRIRSLGDRVEADLFCGFSFKNGQGGLSLSPTLLDRLARTGLNVGLCPYRVDLDHSE